jgi:hypothetical protein
VSSCQRTKTSNRPELETTTLGSEATGPPSTAQFDQVPLLPKAERVVGPASEDADRAGPHLYKHRRWDQLPQKVVQDLGDFSPGHVAPGVQPGQEEAGEVPSVMAWAATAM